MPRHGSGVADCLAASMLGGQLPPPPRLTRPSGACMGFGAGCHWTGFCDKVQAFDGSSGVLACLVGVGLRMSALWFASSRCKDGARIGVRSVLVLTSEWMALGWCCRAACIWFRPCAAAGSVALAKPTVRVQLAGLLCRVHLGCFAGGGITRAVEVNRLSGITRHQSGPV